MGRHEIKFSVVCLLLLLGIAKCGGAGKQLTGAYTPAASPALSPEEAQKRFVVPEGFEVRLFAAEPDVINPVAMTERILHQYTAKTKTLRCFCPPMVDYQNGLD